MITEHNQINIAQIGCGYWGPNLLRNLDANGDCRVVRVVDVSQERLDFVKRRYPHVEITSNVRDILDDSSIDAVVIATPVASHFTLAMEALEKGKHVLVEKPMAKNVAEINQIDIAAKNNKLVAMVGHVFLFNPAVRYLKRIVDSGELGDILYIYSHRLNLGRIRSDVDALWNFAPHDVSIIQYLLNDARPASVTIRGMDYIQKGINDVVFMHIQYPDKVMANVHVSWLDPNKTRRMTVVGSKKMVVYDDVSENKIAIYNKGINRRAILGHHMDFDELDFFKFEYHSGDVLFPKIDFAEPIQVEISHFVDCIRTGIKCMTGTEHAREVVRILEGGEV